MKRIFWLTLGFICIGMAYIGIVTPGIPFSIFLVCAAYCFSKSSPKMHTWLYNHKLFGKFLTNWSEKRVFPTKMKFSMIIMMTLSLAILWFITYNTKQVTYCGIAMVVVAIWAWRYPGSADIYNHRIKDKKKIGWLN